MSDLFKQTFRGYLIDHHSPAPPIVTFDKLDIKDHEEFYRQANISNLMLYTKDHWGYSYYDTKIGTKHPALDRDWIAEVVPVLRKHNIEFNAYYCVEYDTNTPATHPEWAIRDEKGDIRKLKGRLAKWGLACYETGYRNYVLGQVAEVVSNYKPDSLFLDIFGKTLCYCDCCKKKFKATYGYDLPEDSKSVISEIATLSFGDVGRDINRFLEDCAAEMLQDIINTVKSIDSEIKVTINFAALYPKRIRDMLDYQFTEPWAGNWLSAAYSRDTAKNQYPQLGPGDVSQVFNYKSDDVYRLAAAQIAAGGCRVFFYSESMHVNGALDHTEASKVGKAFEDVKKFEQYLNNREVYADIAIIQSDSSSMAKSGVDVVINAIGRCKKADAHREAVCGAMRVCDRLGYTWRVLPEQEATINELQKYKCVFLAGVYCINNELKQGLEHFVSQGGKIVSDGESGLYSHTGELNNDFALADILGVSFMEKITRYDSSEWGGYIRPERDPVWKYTPDTTPPTASSQIGVAVTKAKVLGQLLHPATELTETAWVNWGCPPPASEISGFPALTSNEGCVYIAYEFFRMVYSANYLNISMLEGILDCLLASPSIRLVTPTHEALSIMAYKRGNSYIVHEISHLAEKLNGNAPYIAAGALEINLPNVSKATLRYPQEKELPIVNGRIELPDINIHQIIEIE